MRVPAGRRRCPHAEVAADAQAIRRHSAHQRRAGAVTAREETAAVTELLGALCPWRAETLHLRAILPLPRAPCCGSLVPLLVESLVFLLPPVSALCVSSSCVSIQLGIQKGIIKPCVGLNIDCILRENLVLLAGFSYQA